MIGEVRLFARNAVPAGWYICDGSPAPEALRRYVGKNLPKMGTISVTAHLEPEGDGTHEKVIAQAKTDGLLTAAGLVYAMSAVEDSLNSAQLNTIREIARQEAERLIDYYLREST